MQEIASPNANGIKNEQRHPLYMTQRQHTHPHIMKNAFHFGKDRHIPDQKKGQYQYSQHTDDSNIEMPRSKDLCQNRGIRAGFFKKVSNTLACIIRVTPVINDTHSVSINRSATTVPSDLEKDVPSYLANTPQREISPTRGTTKLAA